LADADQDADDQLESVSGCNEGSTEPLKTKVQDSSARASELEQGSELVEDDPERKRGSIKKSVPSSRRSEDIDMMDAMAGIDHHRDIDVQSETASSGAGDEVTPRVRKPSRREEGRKVSFKDGDLAEEAANESDFNPARALAESYDEADWDHMGN